MSPDRPRSLRLPAVRGRAEIGLRLLQDLHERHGWLQAHSVVDEYSRGAPPEGRSNPRSGRITAILKSYSGVSLSFGYTGRRKRIRESSF